MITERRGGEQRERQSRVSDTEKEVIVVLDHALDKEVRGLYKRGKEGKEATSDCRIPIVVKRRPRS